LRLLIVNAPLLACDVVIRKLGDEGIDTLTIAGSVMPPLSRAQAKIRRELPIARCRA
jgi:hypothetical protein